MAKLGTPKRPIIARVQTMERAEEIAYLQKSGLDLRLRYVKHLYGPYAHNLNKVVEVLERHFIRGYGDTHG